MKVCDNKSEAHDLHIIHEDHEKLRVLCSHCKHQYVIGKDERGAPEKRLYAKLYAKDILQGSDNLFYKYHPEYLHI